MTSMSDDLQPCLHEKHRLKLDTDKVPEVFRHLVPLAERWGIYGLNDLDDFEIRHILIDEATSSELDEMIELMNPHMIETSGSPNYLYSWLASSEAYGPDFSPEYLAFTFLGMLYDAVYSDRNKLS
jgi:hypothetical protein